MNKDKTLLWGGKAKARIAAAMLEDAGRKVDYIFDPYLAQAAFPSEAEFGNELEALRSFIAEATHFIVCFGGEQGLARFRVSELLEKKFGLTPLNLLHDNAFVDSTTLVGQGFQAMPGAVVHKFCKIGDYCVVNCNATVDHECILGNGVHVMGAAAIAGNVSIGNFATIGTNATILPNLTIGEGAFVGAGAVVTKDVPAYQIVAGIPAKTLRPHEPTVDLSLLEQCLD